ncbi:unnamed protein product [Allacma fusca]|uniref:Uncharacterized protein n=1 Tax=Allacma fusca TaxID=39272 RepID=A0A8J2P1W3_9HEXA|nr:unnamed protein product [Allacma fusca]
MKSFVASTVNGIPQLVFCYIFLQFYDSDLYNSCVQAQNSRTLKWDAFAARKRSLQMTEPMMEVLARPLPKLSLKLQLLKQQRTLVNDSGSPFTLTSAPPAFTIYVLWS